MNAFYGMEKDWKGRKDEGFALDGSYIAARLGNWSASFGQVERWWGPGWDGSLILSTNARPSQRFRSTAGYQNRDKVVILARALEFSFFYRKIGGGENYLIPTSGECG